MKKRDLINEISHRTNCSTTDTEKILNNFIVVVQESLRQGEEVYFAGFGTISTKEIKHKARKGSIRDKVYKTPDIKFDSENSDMCYREVFGMVNALN